MGGIFTESATNVMRRAAQEAVRMNHPYVSTEHVLLALLEDCTVVAELLNMYRIQPAEVRRKVEMLVEAGDEAARSDKLPLTPRTKIAIEYALKESRLFGDSLIGPQFLLLGLLRERENAAAQVLWHFGLRADAVRDNLKRLRERD